MSVLLSCASVGLAQAAHNRALLSPATGTTQSSTYVVPPPNALVPGQAATLQVEVEQYEPLVADSYGIPSGTVTVYYQQIELAVLTLNEQGTATFSVPTNGLAPGSYPITAAYGGDSVYLPSSGTSNVTIIAAEPTATSFGTYPQATWVAGDNVYLAAYVTSSFPYAFSGKVTFTSGTLVLGSAEMSGKLPNNYGVVASVPTPNVPVGTYYVVAAYSGDAFHAPSSTAPLAIKLVANTTTHVRLTVTPYSLVLGDTATIVASVYPDIGEGPPTGTVNILVNGIVLSSLPLQPGAGESMATLNVATSGLPAGTYLVTADYLGDSKDLPSSGSAGSFNLLDGASVSLSASPNPVTAGTATFLTAKVTGPSGAPAPTGQVDFYYGDALLGGATLDETGTAQLPLATSGLSPGSYGLEANYSGDSNYGFASGTVTLDVQ